MSESDRLQQTDRDLNTPGECEAELKKLLNTSKAKLREMEDIYGKKLEEQERRSSMNTERLLKEQHEKYREQLALQEKKNQEQMEMMMQRLKLNSLLPGGQMNVRPRGHMNNDQGESSPKGFGFDSDVSEDDEVHCNSGSRKYQEEFGGAKSRLSGGQEAAGGRHKIPGMLSVKTGLSHSTPRSGQGEDSQDGTPPPNPRVKFLTRGVESGNSYIPYETQRSQYSQEELAVLRRLEQQGHDDRVMLDTLAAMRGNRTVAEGEGVRDPPGGDRNQRGDRNKDSQEYQDNLERNLMRNINHFKEFSGTKAQEFSSWYDDWKIWCEMNRLRELNDIHMQKTLFLSRLSGDARVRVSNSYSPETQKFRDCRTLDELMRGVKGIFCHLSDSGYLINVFETLQQSGADVQDYFSRKYRAFNEAYGSHHSPLAVFRESFIRGLDRSSLQEELLKIPVESPEQLREAVVRLSGMLATARRLGLSSEGACNRVGRGYQGPVRGDLKCNHCQRSGHSEDSCWTKNPGLMPDWAKNGQVPPGRAAPSFRATPGGCWICGQLGHLAATCPKPGPVGGAPPVPPAVQPPAVPAAAVPETGSVVTIHEDLKQFLLSSGEF